MFFRHAVHLLRRSGKHEVLCTCRQYREAVALARMKKLRLTVVGRHGGADRYEKLFESARRTASLARVVKRFDPDTAISFSSPEGSRVAYGLGIRSHGFNDSPHADAVARLTVPLMDKLFCPWVIPYNAWRGYGISSRSIIRYSALDPAAWLKHENQEPGADHSDRILLRMEESKASYVADRKLETGTMIDDLVNSLHRAADILVLCRYRDQIAEVESRYGSKVHVLKDVVDGTALIKSVQLFVGAGGTMTAEAALLGKPTISISPVRFHVEDYLVKMGLVGRAPNSTALVRLAKKMMSDKKYQNVQKRKAARVLQKMEDPTDVIIKAATASVGL